MLSESARQTGSVRDVRKRSRTPLATLIILAALSVFSLWYLTRPDFEDQSHTGVPARLADGSIWSAPFAASSEQDSLNTPPAPPTVQVRAFSRIFVECAAPADGLTSAQAKARHLQPMYRVAFDGGTGYVGWPSIIVATSERIRQINALPDCPRL